MEAVCQLPFAQRPGEAAGPEVLSDEQTLLVLALVRQAQETKVPKCVVGRCRARARELSAARTPRGALSVRPPQGGGG